MLQISNKKQTYSITPKNFVPANDVISFLFTFRRLQRIGLVRSDYNKQDKCKDVMHLQLVKLNVRSSSDEIWLSLRSSSLKSENISFHSKTAPLDSKVAGGRDTLYLVEAGNWTPVSDAILLFARFSFLPTVMSEHLTA